MTVTVIDTLNQVSRQHVYKIIIKMNLILYFRYWVPSSPSDVRKWCIVSGQ